MHSSYVYHNFIILTFLIPGTVADLGSLKKKEGMGNG